VVGATASAAMLNIAVIPTTHMSFFIGLRPLYPALTGFIIVALDQGPLSGTDLTSSYTKLSAVRGRRRGRECSKVQAARWKGPRCLTAPMMMGTVVAAPMASRVPMIKANSGTSSFTSLGMGPRYL